MLPSSKDTRCPIGFTGRRRARDGHRGARIARTDRPRSRRPPSRTYRYVNRQRVARTDRHDVLSGKVHDVTLQIAVYAASHAPAQEVPHALGELAIAARELVQDGTYPLGGLGLLASRQRVAGYADAQLDDVDAQNFDEIEDELFRWARTVEGNLELRRLLLDRDADLASRLGTVQALLGDKVDVVTLALAKFVIEGVALVTSSGRWTTSWTTSPRPGTGGSRACTPRDHSMSRVGPTSSRR